MLARDHEAVETKPKAEEQEKIDIRPRGPSDRLGAQQEPGDHAKMRREALEARMLEHCEGLLQGILDENISEQQLRVKFEDLLSVKGQLDAQHL